MSTSIDARTREAISLFLERVKEHYTVQRAVLFGSRARGDHEADSDADVAVILPGTHGDFWPTRFDMADTAYDVMLETGVYVQPLPVWEDEWAAPATYNNPSLIRNILREGITL